MPTGQRDYSSARLTRHALDRFVERFGVDVEQSDPLLREALARTRRLGRNPDNDAVDCLSFGEGRAQRTVGRGVGTEQPSRRRRDDRRHVG